MVWTKVADVTPDSVAKDSKVEKFAIVSSEETLVASIYLIFHIRSL